MEVVRSKLTLSWTKLAIWLPKVAEKWTKYAPSCPQVGPSWFQDGFKLFRVRLSSPNLDQDGTSVVPGEPMHPYLPQASAQIRYVQARLVLLGPGPGHARPGDGLHVGCIG